MNSKTPQRSVKEIPLRQTPVPKPAHSFEKYLLDVYCKDVEYLKQKKHKTHLHRAIIVKRNKILAEATNLLGSRSMGCGFSDWTIHAEKAVVKKLGDLNHLRGADLYVFRVGNTEQACFSKPCADCECFLKKCMREYGLRFVFYSI
jgi:hypothetical protein